jgi:hypothetical protein
LDEKFRAFSNILYEFTYPEPEPGLKAWAPAPPKSGCSTGSGSATLVADPNNKNPKVSTGSKYDSKYRYEKIQVIGLGYGSRTYQIVTLCLKRNHT